MDVVRAKHKAHENHHVYTNAGGGVMQCQGVLGEKITLVPNERTAQKHARREMDLKSLSRTNKAHVAKMKAQDPAIEQKRKAREQVIRNRKTLKQKKRQIGYSGDLTADFLDGDDEETSIDKVKRKWSRAAYDRQREGAGGEQKAKRRAQVSDDDDSDLEGFLKGDDETDSESDPEDGLEAAEAKLAQMDDAEDDGDDE